MKGQARGATSIVADVAKFRVGTAYLDSTLPTLMTGWFGTKISKRIRKAADFYHFTENHAELSSASMPATGDATLADSATRPARSIVPEKSRIILWYLQPARGSTVRNKVAAMFD